MSTGFAVLMLLLTAAVFYFRWRQACAVAVLTAADLPPAQPQPCSPAAEAGELDLPSGYRFHLGHTWMAEQRREMAHVGLDSFAARLLGKVERITVIGEQRWVRQGQKLMTVSGNGETVDLLSPLEGVVTAINPEVIRNPQLAFEDPYNAGWICAIKSPEMETNRRNLVQSALAANWMHDSMQRLKTMLADPALAQDGGMPQSGLLSRLGTEMRRRVVSEFFLT